MVDIQSVYVSFIQCLNERRWDDLPQYIHGSYEVDGQRYTPASYAAEAKHAGEVEVILDAVTVDEESRRLASNVLVRWKPSRPVMGFEPPNKVLHFMEQRLNWFTTEGKLSRTIALPDREVIERQLSDPQAEYALEPDLISTQVNKGGSSGTELDGDLETIYREYLDCINRRTMETDLPKFCHPHVFHNRRALPLHQYRQLMQDAITAIPDINYGLHTIIADRANQRVAVRLEFTGTPVKAMAGVEPTGRAVRFAEHVTYQFRDGKIYRVWSQVDWISYRQQLVQGH